MTLQRMYISGSLKRPEANLAGTVMCRAAFAHIALRLVPKKHCVQMYRDTYRISGDKKAFTLSNLRNDAEHKLLNVECKGGAGFTISKRL